MTSSLSNITLSQSFVNKRSDSDERFDILMYIKPYSFEPLAKNVTGSIKCEELAAASAYTTRVGLVCICLYFILSLIDKSTRWA